MRIVSIDEKRRSIRVTQDPTAWTPRYAQGAVVVVSAPKPSHRPRPPSKRKPVTDFTPRSRRRLAIRLHRMNWPRRVLFLTLTFKDPPTDKQAKDQLHRFLIWVRRNRPKWTIVWKLEFQERGAHHYHVLLIPDPDETRPYIPKKALDRIWRQGYTWIESVPQKRIHGYILKYVGKPPKNDGSGQPPASLDQRAISEHRKPGRYWGIRGPVYWAPVITTIPRPVLEYVAQVMARIKEKLDAMCVPMRGTYVIMLREPVTWIPPARKRAAPTAA